MSQTTRRCHWIPKAYLKYFRIPSEEGNKIWRCDVNNPAKDEKKDIDNVAFSNHLYCPKDENNKRDDSFEKELSDFENIFNDNIWKSLVRDQLDIATLLNLKDINLRRTLALIVGTMYLRTPEQLKQVIDIGKIFCDKLNGLSSLNSMSQEPLLETHGKIYNISQTELDYYKNLNDNDSKKIWIKNMVGNPIYEYIINMNWAIMSLNEPILILSDNPIVYIHPSGEYKGLKNKEAELIFPLTPKRFLFMSNEKKYDEAYHDLESSLDSINYTTIFNSTKHFFTSEDPVLLRKRIDDYKNATY